MNVKKTAAAALALSAALMTAPALADGFAVYENSARGVGMSGAMMFSDEASLVAYNPAGLWRLKDNGKGQILGSVTYIAPRGWADFHKDDGTILSQHNKNNPAYVPTLYWAKKLNDRVAVGIGAFARFGLRCTWDPGWYGRFSNRNAEYAAVSLAPAVSFKLAKNLWFGLTGEIMYAQLKMDKSIHYGPLEVGADLKGDNIGYGWGAGLDWQPTEKLSLAFMYRSEVKQELEGDLNLHSDYLFGGVKTTTARGHVHMPESFTFGVGWKFDDRTRMEFDAIKTMWNSYDKFVVHTGLPAPLNVVGEDKCWRNGWRYQFGIEHKLNEKWTIRAGFTYDTESAHNPEYNDFMVPTGTRRTYTLGASYRRKNVEYSIGYGYMYVSDKWINHGGEKDERARFHSAYAHIISIGAKIDL